MHELSVAIQIRNVLEAELAGTADPTVDTTDDPTIEMTVGMTVGMTVETVRIQVGALANIVPEALEFAWPHAMAGSPLLATSTVEIEWVDARLRCSACAATHITANLLSLRCPACGSDRVEVVAGEELDIVDVDVHDSAPAPP